MSLSLSQFEKILPIFLAIALASLGIFLNASVDPYFIWANALLQWLFYLFFLLAIWFFNLKISKLSIYKILIINVFIVLLLGTTAAYLFSLVHYFAPVARFAMPTMLFLILQQYLKSLKQGEQLKIENLQLKAENYQAELENLKKQLNPHFLFNSLTTLQTVIRTDPVVAENYVIKLADIYRKMLQNANTDKTTLKEEVDFIESYVFLLHTRFENGLEVQLQVLPAALHHALPSFALQLLVENCIKHNIVSEEKPLKIRIFQTESAAITVANNYQPKRKKDSSNGTGLANLRRRYELLGIENGVEIIQNEQEYSVTLKLF